VRGEVGRTNHSRLSILLSNVIPSPRSY
jgi:hypothetical protein